MFDQRIDRHQQHQTRQWQFAGTHSGFNSRSHFNSSYFSLLSQIAIATLLLNLTIIQTGYAEATQCQQLSETILNFLLWTSDAEATYRSYRGLGNLLKTAHGSAISAQIVSTDHVMDKIRENMNASHVLEKLNEISRDIVEAL